MFSWSARRQLLYLLIPFGFTIVIGYFLYSTYIYHAPSCFDGVKNGTETGVDCGGSCSLICSSDTLSPVVLWSKSFNVTGTVWNAVAYVQNPNITSTAHTVSYRFDLYDIDNHPIVSRTGSIDIPKNKTFTVFESGIIASASVKRTEFSFTSSPIWIQDTTKDPLFSITHNPIENASTSPKITGTVINQSLQTILPMELVVLILDGQGNALGASKTVTDTLPKGKSTPFVFTWPKPFPVGVDVCEISSNTILVLDRSGSMANISKNPDQPLTDVKNTAIDFLALLHPGDSAGIVSFGSIATLDQPITTDVTSNKTALQQLAISSSTSDRNTNIADGLSQASLQMKGLDPGTKRVIILLTDGVPTAPVSSTQVNYPTVSAEEQATTIRAQGVDIFTIGLGKDVDIDILQNIAGSPTRFFSAPTTATLSQIYRQIGQSICERKPNVVEIISRFLR